MICTETLSHSDSPFVSHILRSARAYPGIERLTLDGNSEGSWLVTHLPETAVVFGLYSDYHLLQCPLTIIKSQYLTKIIVTLKEIINSYQ